jgi:hypothetical protein
MPSINLCVCMFSFLSLLGNSSAKTLPRQQIRNNRKIIGRIIFCAVRVISKENLWVYLCLPLSFRDIGSANTFPLRRGILEPSFPIRCVLYQKKVGDQSFLELFGIFNMLTRIYVVSLLICSIIRTS